MGPYEVLAALGAGGMGEVYRARDAKLGRDVALKVLPARTAEDQEVLARFEREARAVAALSHPNILAIHDVGRDAETPFAVMELLEGETLRARLHAGGALPPRRALEIARQIAAGLAAAHERGIVHRDLKPENLFVLRDGRVKILDFGLARVSAAADVPGSDTPTRSIITETGVVMGTAAYMSPEQARGLAADARSDLFSFGAVLYEMLSGRPAFLRATAADTLSAVLREEPPEMPASATAIPALERIVRRCLEKDPVARFHSASDLCFSLDALPGASGAMETRPVRPARPPSRERAAWLLAVAVTAALAAGIVTRLQPRTGTVPLRATLLAPDDVLAQKGGVDRYMALSPDGRRLAFSASPANLSGALYVRPLDTLSAKKLEGTTDGEAPFWSPDGRAIAFFAGKKLKTVPADGGAVTTLGDAESPAGGTWLPDGTIVYGSWNGPLMRIPSTGGTPEAVIPLDKAHDETSHAWPQAMPDGRHLTFYVNGSGKDPAHPTNALYGMTTDGKELHFIRKDNSLALFSEGNLYYVNPGEQLMAVPFDPVALATKGSARIVQEGVGWYAIAPHVLVTQPPVVEGDFTLAWYDAGGHPLTTLGAFEPALSSDCRSYLSPDGRWMTLSLKPHPETAGSELWLMDAERGVSSLFARSAEENFTGIWTPSGEAVVFASARNGFFDLFYKTLGGEERPVAVSKINKVPAAITPDGREIVFYQLDQLGDSTLDIYQAPLDGSRPPRPLLATKANEVGAWPSPDGHRALYLSDESGSYQLWVASFPGLGGRRAVTAAGEGFNAHWRPDGGAILYADGPTLLSVAVGGGAEKTTIDKPKKLLTVAGADRIHDFAVSPDGRRYLIWSMARRAPPPLTITTERPE